MWDLGQVVIGAGFQDGTNPCTLMTCAVFIVYGIWASGRYAHSDRLRWLFVLTYVFGLLCFNFSPMGVLLFHKPFVLTARIIYLALGVGCFVLGVVFVKDWFLLYRNTPKDVACPPTCPSVNGIAMSLITFILAVVLSALATLWPINYYMTLLGAGGLVHGQWQVLIVLLVGYTAVSLWPLWFLWAFLSIKNLRPALCKIVCASVFFVASSSIILFFK